MPLPYSRWSRLFATGLSAALLIAGFIPAAALAAGPTGTMSTTTTLSTSDNPSSARQPITLTASVSGAPVAVAACLPSNSSNEHFAIDDVQSVEQTFTAASNGMVQNVQLELSAIIAHAAMGRNVALQPLQVQLTTLAGTGQPGSVLASSSVSSSTVPSTESLFPISFSTPATVFAGQMYALVLSVPGSGSNGEYRYYDAASPCTGSTLGSARQGQAFSLHTGEDGTFSVNTIPSGTVRFTDGTTTLGTEPLTETAIGVIATLSTDALPAGSQTVTAAYSGDGGYAPSSGSQNQMVQYRFHRFWPKSGTTSVAVNRTLPVVFTLQNANGGLVRNASATLTVNGQQAVPFGSINQGDHFREFAGRYVYLLHLPAQHLTGSTVTLRIQVSDGSTHTMTWALRSPVPSGHYQYTKGWRNAVRGRSQHE